MEGSELGHLSGIRVGWALESFPQRELQSFLDPPSPAVSVNSDYFRTCAAGEGPSFVSFLALFEKSMNSFFFKIADLAPK